MLRLMKILGGLALLYALMIAAVLTIVHVSPAAQAGSSGAPGFANPMTTAGDLIYGGASGAATRIGSTANRVVGWNDTTTAVATFAARFGVFINRTTAQSIVDDGEVVQFNIAAAYENGGDWHDSVTNNSRLTVPAGGDGKYALWGWGAFANSATGLRRRAYFTKNGVAIDYGWLNFVPINGTETNCYAHVLGVSLVAGDYVEFFADQDTGGALNLNKAAVAAAILPLQ